MTYIDSIVLGLVQGATEFLPISSSGHLVITSYLLNINNAFTFDVLLNFGTLGALIAYYRKKIWQIIKRTFLGKEWTLLAKIIAATLPAAFFGLTFESQIEKFNETVWVVVTALFVVGLLMIFKGKAKPGADDQEIEKSVGWQTAAKVGLAQACALVPGVSRSGITILVGLQSKLNAKKAAEFSFLLAIPIITAASFKMLLSHDGLVFVKDNLSQVLVGNLASLISGLIAVSFLIKLLGSRGLKDFGWYRIALAIVLAILLLTGII